MKHNTIKTKTEDNLHQHNPQSALM